MALGSQSRKLRVQRRRASGAARRPSAGASGSSQRLQLVDQREGPAPAVRALAVAVVGVGDEGGLGGERPRPRAGGRARPGRRPAGSPPGTRRRSRTQEPVHLDAGVPVEAAPEDRRPLARSRRGGRRAVRRRARRRTGTRARCWRGRRERRQPRSCAGQRAAARSGPPRSSGSMPGHCRPRNGDRPARASPAGRFSGARRDGGGDGRPVRPPSWQAWRTGRGRTGSRAGRRAGSP